MQEQGTQTASAQENNEIAQKVPWQTVTWVILALLAAAIEPIIVKLGYRSLATPIQLIFIKSIVGGILIIPLTRNFKKIPAKSIKRIFIASLLFLGITSCIFASLVYLSAIEVITITTTTPALVAMVNQKKGKDILDLKFWLGFIMCFAGVLLTVEIYKANTINLNYMGLAFAFASVIGSAAYRTRMDDITAEVPPLTASTYLFLFNALVALILIPWLGTLPKQALLPGIWMGFAGAIANIAFLAALHLLGSTRISIFGMLQRPLVIIATALILKESLNIWQLAGIVMVMIGIQWAKVKKAEDGKDADTKQADKEQTDTEKATSLRGEGTLRIL